ncbi:MAG TPA: thioredoxin domain-containing protein [Phycisphaerales bacterium]|nr:thioredoxin domain-containing protein [Phycisphaerales bacterium]
MKSPRIFALSMILALVGAAPAVVAQDKPAAKEQEATMLKVGDTAPKLQIEKFVKGKPVENLDKGIYVVEFWATWCGPCIRNIPHLTEMQKEYKDKVRFIGVSIWEENNELEDGKYLDRVTEFVKNQGDKMDYTVAYGGSPAPMSDTWMRASGQGGIPSAFIVKDNKIQWIGHPAGMDKVLKEVVAGTYDLKAASEKSAKAAASAKKQRELMAKLQEARTSGDEEAEGKIVDELIELNPERNGMAAASRFKAILENKGETAAYEYAKKMTTGPVKDNAMVLNAISWSILDDEGYKNRDIDLAMDIAKRAVEITDSKNAAILDTLARAYWEKKDVAKAVEIQEKAVKALTDSDGDEMREEVEGNLKKYKGAKN